MEIQGVLHVCRGFLLLSAAEIAQIGTQKELRKTTTQSSGAMAYKSGITDWQKPNAGNGNEM